MQPQLRNVRVLVMLGLHPSLGTKSGPSLRPQQIQRFQLILKLPHRTPWKNWRVLPLVRGILQQPIRPTATTHQRQQRPVMQPGKTNLRDRPGTAADDDTCITGERHEQVSRIAHAAGNDNRCRPIRLRHLRLRNDAYHQGARGMRTLRGDARSRASASADNGYAHAGEQFPGVPGKIVCMRSRLRASQYADLRTTDAGHGFLVTGSE
jgi:hypothetical protein